MVVRQERTMNVGFINNFGNYPPKGGSSVHVYQLIKGFADSGHTVCALQGDYPFDLFKRYERNELGQFLKDIDVLYLRLGGGLRQDISSFLKWARPLTFPLVWEINAPASERQNLKSGIIEFCWKAMAGLVDAAVCVSEEIEVYAQEYLHIRNTKVIPNGSDPTMFHPDRRNRAVFSCAKEDDFVVLWAGSSQFITQGLGIIFDVAERMQKIEQRVKFVLITDSRYIRRKLPENMEVYEQIPYLSMPEYVASSDLCLCLYQEYSWSKIGFYPSPLKLFDYMSCARPVIASNMGQIARVIRHGENGLLANNDPDDIVKKIQSVFNDKEKATEIGAGARLDIINRYNWANVVEETVAFFRQVIQQKKDKI
jgi:glycosyltransferase involved in cell wall biosynthesis